jgi:ankyrin repeat protein
MARPIWHYGAAAWKKCTRAAVSGNWPALVEQLGAIPKDQLPQVMRERGDELLPMAASWGNARVCAGLIDQFGANVDHLDKNKRTALAWAAYNAKKEVVTTLLARGANPNHPLSPALGAAIFNTAEPYYGQSGLRNEVVELLLQHGANPNGLAGFLRNQVPVSLMDETVGNMNYEIVELLLRYGGDPLRATTSSKATPWEMALKTGSDERAARPTKVFLDSGVDPNTPVGKFDSLTVALLFGGYGSAALLIARGADVNYQSTSAFTHAGQTPLILCAVAGGDDMVNSVQMLLDAGADVLACDVHGNTALHYASAGDSLDLVRLLVEHGADFRARNRDGKLPIDFARTAGHQHIVTLLQAAAARDVAGRALDDEVLANVRPL